MSILLISYARRWRLVMQITDETIDYVGILAKLELTAEEREKAKTEMANMLEYVSKINELDTENVEISSDASTIYNVFREDEVTNCDDRENILSNAPERLEGNFKVPRTFGG